MKRSLKSLLALMLAYFMLIAGTCDGVFSVAVLAAEREDAFAYADSLTHDAADNGAVGTAVTGDEDVFGVLPAAPEDAGVGQIMPGNTEAKESEKAALYETGDALTTLLKVELREDVSLKTSYEPGGIVLLELNLASATFYKVDDDKKEPVSVTQKGESILYKEVAGVHVGNNNKCVLDPEDIEFNEEGYVLAETELPFEVTPIDMALERDEDVKLPVLKAGKTISAARLKKAVRIDTEEDTDITEDKEKWSFALDPASAAAGTLESGVFTAAGVSSAMQAAIVATYPAVDVDGDGTAEYNKTSVNIVFNINETLTLSQNLRFKCESEFVDGVYEVENSVGALYDLSVESDDRKATKYYYSSDPGILKIDRKTGIMSPGKNGEAIVTARSVGTGSYVTEEIQVTVKIANMVTWLEPEYNNVTLQIGGSIELPVSIEPAETTTGSLSVTTVSATQNLAIPATSGTVKITVNAGNTPGFSIVTIQADDKRGTNTCILVQTVKDINDKSEIIDVSKADPEALKDLANYEEGEIKDVLFKKNDSTGLYEPNLWVGGYEPSYEYTGQKIKPEPNVYEGLTRLIKKKDYTLSFGKNLNVSQGGTIKVKFKRNYKGAAKTVKFKITPVDLSDRDSVAVGDAVAKSVSAAAPPVYLLGSGKVIKKFNSSTGLKKTYAVSSMQSDKSFIGTVTISADSKNFTGDPVTVNVYKVKNNYNVAKRRYTIKAVDYTDCGIGVTGRYIDGGAQIKSSNGGRFGVDYEVIGVANNIKPGTAVAFIRGIGNNMRGSKKVKFKIRKKSKPLKDGARFIQSNTQVVSGNQFSRLQLVSGINSGLVPVSGINAYVPAAYMDNAVYYAKTGAKIDYYVYDIDSGRRLMEGVDYKLSWRPANIKKVDLEGDEKGDDSIEKLCIKGFGGYSDVFSDTFISDYKIMPVPLDEESGLVVVAATGSSTNKVAVYSRIDGSKFGTKSYSISGNMIVAATDSKGISRGLAGTRGVASNSALPAFKLNPVPYTGTYIMKSQLELKSGEVNLSGMNIEFAGNIAASKSAVAVCTEGSAARAVTFTISKRDVSEKTFTGIAADGTKTSP